MLHANAMEINNKVVAVLKSLAPNLEPPALLDAIRKGDVDSNILGHAYYTVYYKRQHAPLPRPKNLSLLQLYAPRVSPPPPPSLEVVKQTGPRDYVASVCDTILPYDTPVIPPQVFCQAIRNVHPHELKNDYYHLDEICGYPFNEYLERVVNDRLRDYFSVGRSLDDVLNGIKKCLCLRILSNNMYYYREHLDDLDPDIQRLMQFYTLTNFLHDSSQEVFDSHLHMILNYKQLKEVVEELVNPVIKGVLDASQFRFHSIAMHHILNTFVVIISDHGGGMRELISPILPTLQAFVASRTRPIPPRMTSNDMLHKVQSSYSNKRLMFDEGIRLMKVLINQVKTRQLPLSDVFDDLYKIYEHTAYALRKLHKHNQQNDHDDEAFFEMTKQMDRYTRKYRRRRLTSGMVDWSKFDAAGPDRSPSPVTRKRSRSRSRSHSKKQRLNGGARPRPRPRPRTKKFISKSKTRKSKKVLTRK
jgi:hypothetical protein